MGLQALFQDRGRTGHGDTGVPTSGVLDRASARQANRIVGNRGDATVIECLFGGLALQAETDLTLAVTGAEAPVTVGGKPAPLRTPLVAPAGESVEIGAPTHGIRSYVAVRGGFVTSEVLGSTATDTLSRLGPEPISVGQQLKVPVTPDVVAVGGPEPTTLPEGNLTTAELRVVPGPRDDWCAPGELETLTSQVWTVSQESNRIALRLQAGEDGRPLRRAEDTGELASEGMVSGAIQVPPEGQPVLFLADHPVTGGYPVIATVIAEDLDLAAQLPPGAEVRFTIHAADLPGEPS
ncbi:biotin-dependent carboxyltransferase family protein [Brevibacterium luteolum]|uniref:5-oxoprolinase subunit C family protein n=1 Tax=Brevibacterium luteolum TaxID=199591 RepID=UPI001FB6A323|nr:biotin-dependent carboxyltransferase family protein [Brevibacterium luteolum]